MRVIYRPEAMPYFRCAFLQLLVASSLAWADAMDDWTVRYPSHRLTSVAYGSDRFVAVGFGGQIFTSPDGAGWTPASSSTSRDLFGVIYGGGRFVAVGASGAIISSPDGLNWSPAASTNQVALTAVAYANGEFIAAGGGGVILSSNDGLAWVQRNGAQRLVWTYLSLLGVASGNDLVVVVGQGLVSQAAFPADQILTWSDAGLSSGLCCLASQGGFWRGITYADNQFVAVSSSSDIATSTDGTNWVPRLSGTTLMDNLAGVAYGDGLFVAVGASTAFGAAIETSTDAEHWARRELFVPALSAVAFGNGRFVAVGDGVAIFSGDGATWTTAVSEQPFLSSVAQGKGTFVAVGNPGAIITSTNGVVWQTVPSGTQTELTAVTYAMDQFVAVGGSGTILTSANGQSWIARNSGSDDYLTAVAEGDGLIIALGFIRGAVLASSDGIDWVKRPSGIAVGDQPSPVDLAWGNGRFCAVTRASILNSIDGTTWTTVHENQNPLFGIAYALGSFVAVGDGPVLTSEDGVHWTPHPREFGGRYVAVTGGAGHFAAVSNNSWAGLLVSNDGANWMERRAMKLGSLQGVCYADHRFYAVGQFGRILQSAAILSLGISADRVSHRLNLNWNAPRTSKASIEQSSDLKSWEPLTTPNDSDLTNLAVDPRPPAFSRRFYRARAQAP